MSVHTMKEATKGLTPEEIWSMRIMRRCLRAILLSDNVTYTTKSGGIELERLEIKIGDTTFVMRGDYPETTGRAMGQLFLALDALIYSEDGKLAMGEES